MKPHNFPLSGSNTLPPLNEFTVREVPTLLIAYLKAHGHDDAVPGDAGGINVTHYNISQYNGQPYSFRSSISATMKEVRKFLGYRD